MGKSATAFDAEIPVDGQGSLVRPLRSQRHREANTQSGLMLQEVTPLKLVTMVPGFVAQRLLLDT